MQSMPQVDWFSPHWGWQTPLPQRHVFGQSNGHDALSSPHCGWHCPLPHTHT